MNKTNGAVRYSGDNKVTKNLFDNIEVSMELLRHKVSQTVASTDIPRQNPLQNEKIKSKSKNKSNPKSKIKPRKSVQLVRKEENK